VDTQHDRQALESWIDGAEHAARAAGSAETLIQLTAIRKLIHDQRRRSKAQSKNASAKKGYTLATDLTMLAQYEKRLRNRDAYHSGRSNTAIATDVGRLHGLKKSGALKALERARTYLRVSSTDGGKVD